MTENFLRQNLLVGIEKKTATYRELYPYAIGYDAELDQEIPLQRLNIVFADGLQSMNLCTISL